MSGVSGVGVDLWADVVGQDAAVADLRRAATAPVHAYLLVGPRGSGRRAAARAFAASLLCPQGGDGTCRVCRLVLADGHPDVVVFEPQGAFLQVKDAEEITRLSARSPVEGTRKVLVLTDFERVQVAGPALLKTIEEPPASTVFVILATDVPPELVTIASRCVRVAFGVVPAALVAARLVEEGVEADRARAAAAAAGGDLGRARLLVNDTHLEGRRRAWRQVPSRLDGTGAAVATLTAELQALVEESAAPLVARQNHEAAELEELVSAGLAAPAGRKELAGRQRQHLRRHRLDELRFGLATLAGRYRDALSGGAEVDLVTVALAAIQQAAEALPRNPNEVLLVQRLLLRLPALPAEGADAPLVA